MPDLKENEPPREGGQTIVAWLGSPRETRVPRDVAACPACGGDLRVTIKKWTLYEGEPYDVMVWCKERHTSLCLPLLSDDRKVEKKFYETEKRAGAWAMEHTRCLCYIRRN